MLRNYIIIAFRNLVKNRSFSIINIFGLALGLCCTLLIALWVNDEYSIDKFHTNKDRIYSVITELKLGTGNQFSIKSSHRLSQILIEEVAGIEKVARYTFSMTSLVQYEDKNLLERGIFADPGLFEIFDFPLIHGDRQSALDDPYNIVLSKKLADKLFPDTDPINKFVTIGDSGKYQPHKVTGVLAKIPDQSTLQFDYIIPFVTYLNNRYWIKGWDFYGEKTALLLNKNTDVDEIIDQVANIITKHDEQSITKTHLYPFKDIYLKTNFSKGLNAEGHIIYVRVFSLIAIIIVLIACINFMNLSTARAGKRAKEVGVRKVNGASRNSLIAQFLGESMLISLVSGFLAITLADLMLTPFNLLTGKSIIIPYSNPGFILIMLGLCVLTGFLAGIYPALYLSKFNPSKVLKSAVSSGKSLSGFRRILVITQFSISIIFVIATIIVYSQLQFILNKNVGVKKENIVYHELYSLEGNSEVYRNEILQIEGVSGMTTANFSPINIYNATTSVGWKGKSDDHQVMFHVIQTDQHFVKAFGLNLIDGIDFINKYDSAGLKVIINEEAANTMLSEDVVGSYIEVFGDEAEIVGVVKNFNHQSLEKKIEPVIILLRPTSAMISFISVSGNIQQTVSKIEQTYLKFEKNHPFDYNFVDQDYERNYSQILIMKRLSTVFAVVAILVSCLGLLGLASYMTEQRRKETSIRKVLGATVLELVTMFSSKFLGLVLIALAISTPIVWYLSSQWLDGFAFRIKMGLTPFIIGGVSAILVAILTVSYHTVKAALANPVDSLKYE